ncbi:hypothetical protein BDR04DRAFT_1120302 [Suillus decipiens]|nr:hypothetical protein BDR04DRAFT_1120302 [Suillus decipiens]
MSCRSTGKQDSAAAAAKDTMPWVTGDSVGIFGKVVKVTEVWEAHCCCHEYYAEGKVAEMTGAWKWRDSGSKQLLAQADYGKAVAKHHNYELAEDARTLPVVARCERSCCGSYVKRGTVLFCALEGELTIIMILQLSAGVRGSSKAIFYVRLSGPWRGIVKAVSLAFIPAQSDAGMGWSIVWRDKSLHLIFLSEKSKYWKPKIGPVTGVMPKMRYCKVISCANMVSGLPTIAMAALVSRTAVNWWYLLKQLSSISTSGISHFKGSKSEIGKNIGSSVLLWRPDRYWAGLGMSLSRLQCLPAAALRVQHIGNLLKGKYCKWCKMWYCQHNKEFPVTNSGQMTSSSNQYPAASLSKGRC